MIAIVSGCIENGPDAKPNLVVKLSSESPRAGEEFKIDASARGTAIKEITVDFGREKKSVECGKSTECTAGFSFTPAPGVYSLRVFAAMENGGKLAESRRVVVNANSKGCLNGVEFGTCDSKKPLYCNEGKLEENCAKCGCPAGSQCSGTSCTQQAAVLRIDGLDFPAKAQAGRNFTVKAVLSAEPSGAESKYVAELKIGKNNFSREFSSSGIVEGGKINVEISGVLAEEGTFDVNLSVFSLLSGKQQVGELFIKNGVAAVQKLEELAPPALASVFAEGDDAVLNWANVEGATEYRLYKSSDVNPAYISYKHVKSFEGPETSGVIQNLPRGTHYFVMTAADAFGNESKYSEVKSVDIQ